MTSPFYARGGKGIGIQTITASGSDLVIAMTEGPNKTVTVPALSAAQDSATAAAASATTAAGAKTAAETASTNAGTARTAAEAARDAAATSATNAGTAKTGAETAATTATGAATTATGASDAAAASATAAGTSATNATSAKTAAEAARDAAATSVTNADASATAAAGSATAAAGSSSTASDFADDATAAASSASGSATAAGTSATTADADATSAATARTDAELARDAAATSAAAAQQSAEDAAAVVSDGIPNAGPTVKGGLRLTGDLGGTWDAPTVPGLAGKAPAARKVQTGAGLTGGGDLTADRTIAVVTGVSVDTVCAGDDVRLSDTRSPTDGSVTTAKLGAGAVTAAKIAAGTIPHDVTFVQFGDKTARAAGAGDFLGGFVAQRVFTIKSVGYRTMTADASGSLVVELWKNGSAISGTSKTVAAVDQAATAGAARQVSGLSVSVAVGDVIRANVTSVGTTPGKGLYVDVEGVTA